VVEDGLWGLAVQGAFEVVANERMAGHGQQGDRQRGDQNGDEKPTMTFVWTHGDLRTGIRRPLADNVFTSNDLRGN
jgi:hypothetical protein